MPAIIRWNSDRTIVEVVTPEGTTFGPMAHDGDPQVLCTDDDNPTVPAYNAVIGEVDGLETGRVYRLVPVDTETEEGAELELGEDDEDDEPDPVAGFGESGNV